MAPRQGSKTSDADVTPAAAVDAAGGAAGFARQVAANLRRLRREREWSLEELSNRAGVSRAMLSQVETGKTTPTIAVLWKIATGFGVPFTELLREGAAPDITVVRAGKTPAIQSADRKFRSIPLSPPGALTGVELYRITIDPGGESSSPAHAPGTVEVVSVESGRLRVTVGEREVVLDRGDSACFPADVDHAYASVSDEACVLHDLVQYAPAAGKPNAPAPSPAARKAATSGARRRAGS
jgi:transcriptional regulator with XRE-family HTH domain